jgi:hypothetical protein
MGKGTVQVSLETAVSLDSIRRWLAQGKLPKPATNFAGDFVWSESDIQRLRELDAIRKARRSQRRPVTQFEGPGAAA